MNFTDDDLKRLKHGMSTLRMAMEVSEYSLGKDELEALIVRLECAEKVLNCHALRSEEGQALFRAWLRASGKTGGSIGK